MGQAIVLSSTVYKGSEDKHIKIEYIALPVFPVKVVLTYSATPELNHFERAVLSLLIAKYYDKQELSERLLLNIDLIELILNNLIINEYLDKEYHVTVKGEDTLKGVYSETTSEICYVFYDMNRGRLINTKVNPQKLMFEYTNKNGFIKLETDAADVKINYTSIDISKQNHQPREIEALLERDILNNIALDEKLISVNVIGSEKKHFLITTIETNLENRYGSKWMVRNPFEDSIDNDLQEFIYNNISNKEIGQVIDNLMIKRRDRINQNNDFELYRMIQSKLFNKPISDEHEHIIMPLMRVINAINDSTFKSGNADSRTQLNDYKKQCMLHLGDLFENILYLACENAGFKQAGKKLGKRRDENQLYLTNIANNIGFEVSEDAQKLLSHDLKTLLQVKKKPKTALLGSCIAWNLIIADSDSKYFINQFAKDHPSFINQMYIFKRHYRDKSRHSIEVNETTPRNYINLLFDLIEKSLDYRLNQTVLETYIDHSNVIYDYSYSSEKVRSIIGSYLFDSTNANETRIKQLLVAFYDHFLEESSAYLSDIRAVMEDLVTCILNYLIDAYNITNRFDLTQYVNETKDFEDVLIKHGFDTQLDNVFSTEIEKALTLSQDCEYRIKTGFESKFKNTNLRYKLQTLILLLEINSEVITEFKKDELVVPKLFTTIAGIMFLDKGHKQTNHFSKQEATVIVNDSLEVIKNLINDTNLIQWR